MTLTAPTSLVSPTSMTDADALSVITTDLESSIYVEAGAGTGKTHSLVQRITALLKRGTPIDQIIAITFTRAAAAELRSRIRGELENLRAENPQNEHVAKALEGIDTAAFQTIDSLVYSVLQDHPLDANLPPAIEIQDGFSQLQMFLERWQTWSVEQLESNETFADTLYSAFRLDLTKPFTKLRDLAKSLNEKHAQLQIAEFDSPPRSALTVLRNLQSEFENIRIIGNSCPDPDDKLFVKFEKALDWYTNYVEGSEVKTEIEAEELLITWPNIKFGNLGTPGNWGGKSGKDAALEAINALVDAITDAITVARTHAAAKLTNDAIRFVNAIVQERRRAGTVSYYDTLVWLIDLLDKRGDIRRSIQDRYRYVLVDEFQDTDPDQVRLVRLLTVPPGETKIRPGALFIVGDPKQSIYGFRGAEVTVSQSVKDDITASGGRYLTLTENRRSTRPIIEWVNHTFGKWMSAEPDQADYIRLKQAGDTATRDDFGAVFHFGKPNDEKGINVGTIREFDAKEVATIARAVCAGQLSVRDRQKDNQERPSHAGDLTILTRARSNWNLYKNELENLGVPFSALIGGSAVLDTQEFRDILNCLKAIDDPSDQPATVGALKSIFFGCNDQDLFAWANANGKFSCTADLPDLSDDTEPIRRAMELLRHFNALSHNLQPAILIEQLIRERQTRELMFLEPDPEPGLRRLDLVVELARNFSEEGATSLRDCINRFNQYKDADQDIREQPAHEFDQGKIRLMTMHAAKGLEFPIVILADLASGESNDNPTLLIDDSKVDAEANIGINLGGGIDFRVGNYQELRDKDKAADALEKTRLVYVAATRARDHLFVSRNRKQTDRKTNAAKIDEYVGGEDSSLWSPVPPEWQSLQYKHQPPNQESETTHRFEDRESWSLNHQNTLATASTRPWISPSSIKTGADAEVPESAVKPDDFTARYESDLAGRGRAATNIGSAVHAAIQRVLESQNPNVEQIARSEAERHGVIENADEVASLTSATIRMPLLQHASSLKPRDVWIETPVAVAINTPDAEVKTIEGRVDLIYRRPDGTLGIADFKTDRSFNRSISEMAEPYIPQLGAYAYAVHKATGIPVTEATILFSRLAADIDGEGDYRLPDVQMAIELALKLASTQ